MAAKSPDRNRSVNVNISFDHVRYIQKLCRATRWNGSSSTFVEGDRWKPGSPSTEFCEGPANGPGKEDDISSRFAVSYLYTEILSKFQDGVSDSNKIDTAMEKFAMSEDQCRETNKRLSYLVGMPAELAITDVEKIIMIARRKIKTILGPLSLDDVERGFCFTTGSSLRISKRDASVPHKFSGTPETTFGNLALTVAAISRIPLWKQSLTSEVGPMHLMIVPGNKIITVPKNYKTDRVIAVEPDMNMFVQKGFGTLIRKRLLRAGLDLSTQERNQRSALKGSVDGSLATIDLSMASDTVALELPRLLLPPKWTTMLEQCRCSQGVLPSGKSIYYQKFSSMGNGYTFELETALFYGLALAVAEYHGEEAHQISVYGDDVIVPTRIARALIEVYSFCGFKTNEKKTFIDGHFRESCGKHYFRGTDVTPYYVKSSVCKLVDLFLLHNQLYRWKIRNSDNTYVDHQKIDELLAWIRTFAPKAWRKPRIPDGYGDGAFIGTFDQACPKVACTFKYGRKGSRDFWEGFICEVIGEVAPIADFWDGNYGVMTKTLFRFQENAPSISGRLLQSLSSIRGPSDGIPVGDEVLGGVSLPPRYRVLTMLVPQFH